MRARSSPLAATITQRRAEAARYAVTILDRPGKNALADQVELERALGDLDLYGRLLEQFAGEAGDVMGPYRRGGGASIIADLWARRHGDPDAQRRVEHHRRAGEPLRELRGAGSGAFAGLVVPQYLITDAAPAARAAAPLVSLLARDLPPDGMQATFAAWSTPSSASAQSSENAATTETNLATVAVAPPVRTYVARTDVSRQLRERAQLALDEQILPDQVAAVDASIDAGVIAGPGTGGTITGILSTAGIGTQTYTDGTPTVGEFLPHLEAAYRASNGARKMPPNLAVMHGRRWSWLREGLAVGGLTALLSDPRIPEAVATYGGDLQIVVDNNVPTNLGAGTNEDRVIVCRDDVLRLYVSAHQVDVTGEAAADALTDIALTFRYVAFTAARLPASIVVVSGTGLAL